MITKEEAIQLAEAVVRDRIPRSFRLEYARFVPAEWKNGIRFDDRWMLAFRWEPLHQDLFYEGEPRLINRDDPLAFLAIVRVDSVTGEAEMLPY